MRNLTNRIKIWAEQHDIFNIQQNGFRKNRCTNNNLFKLIQLIKQHFNKSIISTVVIFDVENASGQAWHKGLLTKLYDSGLDISLIKWIKNFLHDRGLIIKINDDLSEPLSPIRCVPQAQSYPSYTFMIF